MLFTTVAQLLCSGRTRPLRGGGARLIHLCTAPLHSQVGEVGKSAADELTTLSGASFVEGAGALHQGPESGPLALYLEGLRARKLRLDDRQERTMHMLQDLYDELGTVRKKGSSGLTVVEAAQQPPRQLSWWSGLLGDDDGNLIQSRSSTVPKGIYMFGGVGCGKTMMMDLLAEAAQGKALKTRRIHFHDFMLDVHAGLRKVHKSQDPLAEVAAAIAAETQLLCLDEFFVTDVADAMILARLFEHLWSRHVVLVATSNRHPDKLYEGGLQRQLFLPFIEKLKAACIVHDLASPVDYRRLAKNEHGTFFIGPTAAADLQARVDELAIGNVQHAVDLPVQMGRLLHIPIVAGCVAKFRFEQLCGEALGAADYIALCEAYHTIAIEGLPILTMATRSQGYRFVTLIDIAYEHRCRMLISAASKPIDIFKYVYTHSDGKEALKFHDVSEDEVVIDDNLGFAKDRTISRLIEMQSDEYREQHAAQRAPHLLQALHEAKTS